MELFSNDFWGIMQLLFAIVIHALFIAFIVKQELRLAFKNRKKMESDSNETELAKENELTKAKKDLFIKTMIESLQSDKSIQSLANFEQQRILSNVSESCFEFMRDTYTTQNSLIDRARKMADKNQLDNIDLMQENTKLKELLNESRLQLEYLNDKFKPTGTSKQLIAKITNIINQK